MSVVSPPSVGAAGTAGTVRRRRRHPMLREVPPAIWAVALVSAVIGGFSGCHPVGGPLADVLVTAAFAGVAVLLASQAGWPTLLLGALVVAALGSPPERVLALVGAVAVVVLDRRKQFEPFGAAVVALVVVQGALRLPEISPARATAAMAALAILPMALSGAHRAPTRLRRRVRQGALLVVGFVVVAGAVAAFTTQQARRSLERGQDEVLSGLQSAKAGDRTGSIDAFQRASVRFSEAKSVTGGWMAWPSRQLPVVGEQVRALDYVARTGGDAVSLAFQGATKVDPDRLRLVDGRLDLDAIREYQPIFADLAARITRLRSSEGDRSRWLLPPVADGLDRFDRTVAKAQASAITAAQAARLAPELLGADRPRRYFVAFVTPAEARASGGFMGNYSVLTIDDGRLDLGPIGRVSDLNQGGDPARKRIAAPADYVARYSRFDPAHYWENVTMSPDFPSVGRVISELFPLSGGTRIDGVLRLDPVALQGLLSLTGPVSIPDLAAPIDESNVVQFLLRDQYALFSDTAKRIDILGDVGRAAFDRLTTGAGAAPDRIAAAFSPRLRSGNMALWMADPDAQAFFRRIGADAGVAPTTGDSFGVVTQNAGASKIDTFLQRSIAYSASLDAPTGRVVAHATVELDNTAPADGLPFYVIGNQVGLKFGSSRSYVSIYSPLALRRATIDGRPLLLVPEQELGRNVYSGFIDLGPGQRRTIELDLSGTVDVSDGHYRFDWVNQVQTAPDRIRWQVAVRGASVTSERTDALATFQPLGRGRRLTIPQSAGAWVADLGLLRSDR